MPRPNAATSEPACAKRPLAARRGAALSERERRFVEAFKGNATEAAIAAGYTEKSAATIGYRLLRKVEIRQAVDARSANDPSVADRKARQRFWTSVMNDPDQEMRDRLKASELLGKSEADFTDKVEHSGKVALEDILARSRSGEVAPE